MCETKETRQRFWTEERKAEFARDYPVMTSEQLVEKYHTTPAAIRGQAQKMGLHKAGRKRHARENIPLFWTKERLAELARDYLDVPTETLAQRYHVTTDAIYVQAKKLNLTRRKPAAHVWTDEENAELIRDYPSTEIEVLAERFKVSEYAVRAQASRLGLSKCKNKWTKEALDELARDYPTTPTEELAWRFHVTTSAVRAQARKMGIMKRSKHGKKPHDYFEKKQAGYHDWSWILKDR